jgi:hypothetical protein
MHRLADPSPAQQQPPAPYCCCRISEVHHQTSKQHTAPDQLQTVLRLRKVCQIGHLHHVWVAQARPQCRLHDGHLLPPAAVPVSRQTFPCKIANQKNAFQSKAYDTHQTHTQMTSVLL